MPGPRFRGWVYQKEGSGYTGEGVYHGGGYGGYTRGRGVHQRVGMTWYTSRTDI